MTTSVHEVRIYQNNYDNHLIVKTIENFTYYSYNDSTQAHTPPR